MPSEKQIRGNWGEDEACLHLEQNGFQIRTRNYRFEKAEIDIIAEKRPILVFVEVKVRKNSKFGFPESFAGKSQIERIKRASEQFQIETDYHGFIRFDIVSILGKPGNFEILHLEDAF